MHPLPFLPTYVLTPPPFCWLADHLIARQQTTKLILLPYCLVYAHCRWIGVSEENETLQNSLENFANQNYAYAREKLGDWVSPTTAQVSAVHC